MGNVVGTGDRAARRISFIGAVRLAVDAAFDDAATKA